MCSKSNYMYVRYRTILCKVKSALLWLCVSFDTVYIYIYILQVVACHLTTQCTTSKYYGIEIKKRFLARTLSMRSCSL